VKGNSNTKTHPNLIGNAAEFHSVVFAETAPSSRITGKMEKVKVPNYSEANRGFRTATLLFVFARYFEHEISQRVKEL
jgi:hypothetical protein